MEAQKLLIFAYVAFSCCVVSLCAILHDSNIDNIAITPRPTTGATEGQNTSSASWPRDPESSENGSVTPRASPAELDHERIRSQHVKSMRIETVENGGSMRTVESDFKDFIARSSSRWTAQVKAKRLPQQLSSRPFRHFGPKQHKKIIPKVHDGRQTRLAGHRAVRPALHEQNNRMAQIFRHAERLLAGTRTSSATSPKKTVRLAFGTDEEGDYRDLDSEEEGVEYEQESEDVSLEDSKTDAGDATQEALRDDAHQEVESTMEVMKSGPNPYRSSESLVDQGLIPNAKSASTNQALNNRVATDHSDTQMPIHKRGGSGSVWEGLPAGSKSMPVPSSSESTKAPRVSQHLLNDPQPYKMSAVSEQYGTRADSDAVIPLVTSTSSKNDSQRQTHGVESEGHQVNAFNALTKRHSDVILNKTSPPAQFGQPFPSSKAEKRYTPKDCIQMGGMSARHVYRGNPAGMERGSNLTQLSLMTYKISKSERVFSLAAAPCRTTLNWMPEVVLRLEAELPGFRFYCIDTEDPISSSANLKAAFGYISGAYIHCAPDMVHESIPDKVDMVVSWLGMQDWGVRKSWHFLKGLRHRGVRLLLLSNDRPMVGRDPKQPVMNVRRSPFLFNDPAKVIRNVAEDPGKQLLLYEMDELREGL